MARPNCCPPTSRSEWLWLPRLGGTGKLTLSDEDEARLAAEADAFLAAHPDLYMRAGGKVRLAIHDGDLLTGSIAAASGFASSVHPDWSTMQPLKRPTPRVSQEQTG